MKLVLDKNERLWAAGESRDDTWLFVVGTEEEAKVALRAAFELDEGDDLGPLTPVPPEKEQRVFARLLGLGATSQPCAFHGHSGWDDGNPA